MFSALLSGLRNFPIGALLGAILGILFMLIIESELSDEYTKYATYGISAFVALLGSGLAIAGVLASIENQKQLAHENRQSSLAAAKASLPLILTELSDIAQCGAEISLQHNNRGQSISDRLQEISLPTETISNLKEAIQFADRNEGQVLANLIRSYQVLVDRTQRWVSQEPEFILFHAENAIHWAIFLRQIENCFAYARGEEDEINPNMEDLRIREFFSVRLGVSTSLLAQLQPDIERILRRENPAIFG